MATGAQPEQSTRQQMGLRVKDVRETSLTRLKAADKPWLKTISPSRQRYTDDAGTTVEEVTADASTCTEPTWGSGISARADTVDASASAESSGRLPATSSFPLDALESWGQCRCQGGLLTTHSPPGCGAVPDANANSPRRGCLTGVTLPLSSHSTPQRLKRSYLATETKEAGVETTGAVVAAGAISGKAAAVQWEVPCSSSCPDPSQCRQRDCSTTAPAPLPRHSAFAVAAACGRLQLRTKIRHSHLCQLQPGACEQLVRLARAWGYALVSFCARPGCLELVMDLVNVAAPVNLDRAGPDEQPASVPLPPINAGSNPGSDVGAHEEHPLAAWPAAELAAWLQQQGLLDPSLEPQLLVQVGDRDVHVQWTEPGGPCADRTVPFNAMPDGTLGLWTAAPMDLVGPDAAASVVPRTSALRLLHIDAPCVLLALQDRGASHAGAPAELLVRCHAAAAAAGTFHVRCGGADLPTKALGSAPAGRDSHEPQHQQQHQTSHEAEVFVPLAVQQVPPQGGLLFVELRLNAEDAVAAVAPSKAACGGGAAATSDATAPSAVAARMLLSDAALCIAVGDAAVAQELRCLRARLAAALGAVEADEPSVQAATDQFLLDLGLLLNFRAAVVTSAQGRSASDAAAHELSVPYGGGGDEWASGLQSTMPDASGYLYSGCAELQRQQRAWLRGQGPDGVALRQHLSDVAATVLAGCVAAILPYTAQLVIAAAAQLQLCGKAELMEAAAGDDAPAAAVLQELLAVAANGSNSSDSTAVIEAALSAQGGAATAAGGGGGGAEKPADGAIAAPCGGAAMQLFAHAARADGTDGGGPLEGLRQRRGVAARSSEGEAAAAAAAPTVGAGAASAAGCCLAGPGGVVSPAPSTAAQPYLMQPRSLAALLRCCVQGFLDPGSEVAYWDFSANQLQGACRLMGYITMGVTLLASARAFFQDGAAVAVFLLLYQGMQALAQLFAAYGTRRALFAAGIVSHAWRNAAHLVLGLGLVPMPSLVLPMSRQYTDLFNEGIAKPVVEQMPLTWFIALCVGEVPFSYCLYTRLNAGQELLTPSPAGRAWLSCVLKVGSALLVQLCRRRAFAKAYCADADAGRKGEGHDGCGKRAA